MRLFLSLALALLTLLANARQITQSEAAAVASDFFNTSAMPKHLKMIPSKKGTPLDRDCQPFYIFNSINSPRFVIVSGNDRATEILGYSDCGNFDPDNIPPQLDALLQQYAEQIESLSETGGTGFRSSRQHTAEVSNGGKLLPTPNWDQGSPYYLQCPLIEGSRCPTGCVATAVAQILKFHRWPDKGEGLFSYNLYGTTRSFDYENTAFNWDLMLDDYGSDFSDEAADEVAKLMYACGVGLSMGYTPLLSGSDISFAKRFLVENMKYDSDARIIYRGHYFSADWNNMITEEIASDRPVYIQGGNHAFVCDGYDGSGLFHFNWGWSGAMNGYFAFSALSPSDDLNFQSNILALVGIRKRNGEKKPLTADLINKGGVELKTISDNRYEISCFHCTNYSANTFKGTLFFEVLNNETQQSSFFDYGEFSIDGVVPASPYVVLSSNEISGFLETVSGLAPGNYSVYPAYKTGDSPIKRIACIIGAQNHVDLSVDADGNYTYSNPGNKTRPSLELVEFNLLDNEYELTNTVYAHEWNLIWKYSIKNNSDFATSDEKIRIYDADGKTVYEDRITAVVDPYATIGETMWSYADIAPGTYTAKILDNTGSPVGDESISFTAIKRDVDITVSDINYEGADGVFGQFSYTVNNNLAVDCAPFIHAVVTIDGASTESRTFPFGIKGNAEMKGDFAIEKGILQGDIELDFYDSYGKKINTETFYRHFPVKIIALYFEQNGFEVSVGESKNLRVIFQPGNAENQNLIWESSDETIAKVDNYGCVTGISPGTAQITACATDGSGASTACNIVVSYRSGIKDVLTDGKTGIAIYNSQGMCLKREADQSDIDALPAGLYIIGGKKVVIIR